MYPYGPALIDDILVERHIDSDVGYEEDAVIVNDHDKSSEEEGDEDVISSEEEGDEDDEEEAIETYYLGKDGITKWSKEIPRPNVRTRSHNIITHLPGVVGDAKQCTTALECFNLFISPYIIEQIVSFTNKRIESKRGKYSQEYILKQTTEQEIMVVPY